jgi:hypothetical protein
LTKALSETDKSSGQGGDEIEMVLVPRLPTEEMIEAAYWCAYNEDAKGVWEKMISAWLQSSSSGNSD